MSFPILICDDSALGRKSARRALPEELNENVQMATNGLEAMDILRRQHISLLLLDLTMPEMDGLEVLQAIKQEHIEVFVVVISADIQPQMKERVLALGALDFMAKPVSAEQLSDTLQQYGIYSEYA